MQILAMHLTLKHQKYLIILYNSLLISVFTYEIKINFFYYNLLCFNFDSIFKILKNERNVIYSLRVKIKYSFFKIVLC